MSVNRATKTTLIGGALAAIVASACCLGPLVLVTVGISGAWISNLTALEPYRPIFIGVALVFMALAYRQIFMKARQPDVVNQEPCVPCLRQIAHTRSYFG